MKKIYVKYKILVNGFNVKDFFECDGFVLKSGYISEKKFYDKISEELPINLNSFMFDCLVDINSLRFKYFESKDFIEYQIPNKYNVDEKIDKLFNAKPEIENIVYGLEQKLRLRFNIPLIFPIIFLEIYDENKKCIGYNQQNLKLSSYNRSEYPISYDESYNNSRCNFDLESMKNVKNSRYQRTLELYNKSFESDSIEIRFILIFSSLEAIFNLDTNDIIKKLPRYIAKLLSEDNVENFNEIEKDINKLYKKRCDYIHGSKLKDISYEDELLLRNYARRVIISYWFLITNMHMTASQVLKHLDSDNEFNIQTKIGILAINSSNFSDQQHKMINLIESEMEKELPEEFKNNILKNCDKK